MISIFAILVSCYMQIIIEKKKKKKKKKKKWLPTRVLGHAHLTHLVLVVSTLLSSVYQYSFNSKQVGFSCKAPSESHN